MDIFMLMYFQLKSNTFIYKINRNTKNILAVRNYVLSYLPKGTKKLDDTLRFLYPEVN